MEAREEEGWRGEEQESAHGIFWRDIKEAFFVRGTLALIFDTYCRTRDWPTLKSFDVE